MEQVSLGLSASAIVLSVLQVGESAAGPGLKSVAVRSRSPGDAAQEAGVHLRGAATLQVCRCTIERSSVRVCLLPHNLGCWDGIVLRVFSANIASKDTPGKVPAVTCQALPQWWAFLMDIEHARRD